MTLFNFNGFSKWFPYWTTSVSIPSIQNDMISTEFSKSYTWNILSILYWSMSRNIEDKAQITLQWLSVEISLHCGFTSPVAIDRMQSCEISKALAMKIPQSCTGPCNGKVFQSVKGLWNLFCGVSGDNTKTMVPLSLALDILQPYSVWFNATRFLMVSHFNKSCASSY